MDQENQEQLVQSRHRSPIFSKDEIQTLVNLIAKHSSVINSKLTNNAANQLKELAWSKITKMFNAQGFKYYRKVDCLKGKWDNLKRDARKVTKNLMDRRSDLNELTSQVVSMVMCEDNNLNEISIKDLEDELNDDQEDSKEDVKYRDNDKEKKHKTDGDNLNKNKSKRFKRRVIRSINFTPQECRLLLQCVRREKKFIFSKECSGRTLALKQQAWTRVTKLFNKHSPHQRTSTMLKQKWFNMKNLTKQNTPVSFTIPKPSDEDCTQFEDEDYERIKKEPEDDDEAENENEMDDQDDVDSMASDHQQSGENSFDGLRETSDRDKVDLAPDPLSTILCGDSGFGSISMEGFNSVNSEVTKLKLQLLKYQLENAKLERKRIEALAASEASLHSARATEAALRVRAARLRAAAAGAALPHGHPALHYPPGEQRARRCEEHGQTSGAAAHEDSDHSELNIL